MGLFSRIFNRARDKPKNDPNKGIDFLFGQSLSGKSVNERTAMQTSVYFEELQTVGDKAVEAIKEQIDIETDGVEHDLQNTTPEVTGGLKASLKRTKLTGGNRYGYRLEYEGNAPDGTPYAKIVSILNAGSSTIKPRRFLTRAVKKLKGLDERAAKRFEEKLKT